MAMFLHLVSEKKLATQLILPFLTMLNASKTSVLSLNTAYINLCTFSLGCSYNTHHCVMYNLLKLPSLNIRRHIHWLQLLFKCVHFNYAQYLQHLLVPYSSEHNLRHSTQYFFFYAFKAPSDWNNLLSNIRS